MLCTATEPYPDQVTVSSNKKITVRLTTSRKSDIAMTIENSSGEKIKEFTDEEILPVDDVGKYNLTTAGSDWYQNSISFITKNGAFFVVRTRWERIIIIDLASNNLLQDIPSEAKDEIQNTIIQKALSLLTSPEPENRQTGAIACGQLQIKKAVPELRHLLGDENYLTTNIPKEWTRVYYVRKSAKEALEKLGETVNGIIIEEPDKDL